MFNQRKAGLVCSFLINIITTIIILSNHLIAQTASNGFINRENITNSEFSSNGFSIYSKIDETVSFPDFFPTLLEMAGLEKPDDTLLRGKSFLDLNNT